MHTVVSHTRSQPSSHATHTAHWAEPARGTAAASTRPQIPIGAHIAACRSTLPRCPCLASPAALASAGGRGGASVKQGVHAHACVASACVRAIGTRVRRMCVRAPCVRAVCARAVRAEGPWQPQRARRGRTHTHKNEAHKHGTGTPEHTGINTHPAIFRARCRHARRMCALSPAACGHAAPPPPASPLFVDASLEPPRTLSESAFALKTINGPLKLQPPRRPAARRPRRPVC